LGKSRPCQTATISARRAFGCGVDRARDFEGCDVDKAEPEGASPQIDDASRLVRDENLLWLMAQLNGESDPLKVDKLRLMIIDEEDRFGRLHERLERADKLIDEARARIEHQQDLINRLGQRGMDTKLADLLLQNYMTTYNTFFDYRQILLVRISRGYL
jgi:hypothetical protein